MKKLLTALLALALCLCLGAWTEGDALALYREANGKLADARSLEHAVDADISVQVMGETMSMTMKGTMGQVMVSQNDAHIMMEMVMGIEMGALGAAMEDVASTVYFRDGYMYTDSMGQKLKTAVSLDEFLDQNLMGSLELADRMVSAARVTESGEGRVISLTVRGDWVSEVLGSAVADALTGLGISDSGVRFSDLSYTMTVDAAGMPQEQRMVYSATMEMLGMDVVMHFNVNSTVLSVNTLESIAFPADLDSYEEY